MLAETNCMGPVTLRLVLLAREFAITPAIF